MAKLAFFASANNSGSLSTSAKALRKVCTRLAEVVERIVDQGDMPVVVGGDHTSAIGTWKGVAHARQALGRIGLLWIDAHMDAHTPQTTESGMLHGMPVGNYPVP